MLQMSCTLIATRDKVILEKSNDGLSLVAVRSILPGEVVLHIAGQPTVNPSRYSVQIDENVHLEGPPEFMGNYINHSCNPSCYIDWPSLSFVALRPINVGEAITFHYCTSEWDMEEKFECRCGAASCLGIIRGAKYLCTEDIEAFLPHLSPFLLHKVSALSSNGLVR